MAWRAPRAIDTWARVFDFGSGTDVNMFLTTSAGSAPRFSITTNGGANEQRLDGTAPLPANRWTHLAVTLSGTTGTLYVNGSAVATKADMTLSPSSLGSTTSNWIGKSQYPADPLLDGTVTTLKAPLDATSTFARPRRVAPVAGTGRRPRQSLRARVPRPIGDRDPLARARRLSRARAPE